MSGIGGCLISNLSILVYLNKAADLRSYTDN